MSGKSLDGVNVVFAVRTDTTKTGDNGYLQVANETSVKIATKVKTTEYELKKNFGTTVNKRGSKGVEFTIETAHDGEDPAYEFMADSQGDEIDYQVWYWNEAEEEFEVKMEGKAILPDLDEEFGANGLATESIKLLGAGPAIRHKVPRARVVTP